MPYWTPPIPRHQYQMAAQGPYEENYDDASRSVNRSSFQTHSNPSSATRKAPLANIPQSSVRDTEWPGLNETNKTPTKASLRGQHRSSLGSGQNSDQEIVLPDENHTHQALSIRKEAVARLSAARQEVPLTARAMIPHTPQSERFQTPLGSQQTVLPPSASAAQLRSQNQVEPDIRYAPSLSLSRTSTISTSLEGSPMPSLTSLLSFGDGVWGHDDIPMLRSRLSETIQERRKVDSGKQGRPGRLPSPLDFGLHDDLPYTPLVDQVDLFAPATDDHNSPDSGLQSMTSRDDSTSNCDGDTTLLDEEWKRVKETGATEWIRDSINAEIAAVCSTRLQADGSIVTSRTDGKGHVRIIFQEIMEHLEKGKIIKGYVTSA